MALPELDIARVQRWCAARVPEHARHQVRVECQVAPRHLTIVERRAPWREDSGPRMDQLSDRASALHRRRQLLDLVLARPQPPIPHLRPARTLEPRRRPAQRDRPRPHLHLLGLTPSSPPADGSPLQLRWDQLRRHSRGQSGLTLPGRRRARNIRAAANLPGHTRRVTVPAPGAWSIRRLRCGIAHRAEEDACQVLAGGQLVAWAQVAIGCHFYRTRTRKTVGRTGFEPVTSSVSGKRSPAELTAPVPRADATRGGRPPRGGNHGHLIPNDRWFSSEPATPPASSAARTSSSGYCRHTW
jgi:hypothetical protein